MTNHLGGAKLKRGREARSVGAWGVAFLFFLCPFLSAGCATGRQTAQAEAPLPEAPAPEDVPVAEAPVADEGNRAASHPTGTVVKKVWIWQESGDCLWRIAEEHYGNPYLWPKIYEANRHLIRNPHVIFPKQLLVIPPLSEPERNNPESVLEEYRWNK